VIYYTYYKRSCKVKPETLRIKLDEIDELARIGREAAEKQAELEALLEPRRRACEEGAESVLEGFRAFVRMAARVNLRPTPPGEPLVNFEDQPAQEPFVVEVALGIPELREHGDGLIVAQVTGYDDATRQLGYESLDTASRFAAGFYFRPALTAPDIEITPAEVFDRNQALEGIRSHTSEDSEGVVEACEGKVGELARLAQDTLSYMDMCARDSSLNPELAERFQLRAPLQPAF
jgi:hypothetical protein